MLRHGIALLSALVLAATHEVASAQCLGPDGLNGPCWTPVTANLPTFPTQQYPGIGICWTNCNPQQQCTDVVLGNPVAVRCGVYNSSLRVSDCLGNPLLAGTLVLDYTRTWEELTPVVPATRYQVWRFTAKIDMERIGTLASPCLVPPCLGPHPTAFYYGYLDYAQDCNTGVFESALVLFHNCDAFIHHPAFSSRPGAFHAGTSYALVGPSTAANPFVPVGATALAGPIVAEAVRNVPPPGALPCITEDPVSGSIQFIVDGCACPFALNPKQTTARILRGQGTCVAPGFGATAFQSVRPGGPFPWLHMITTSIGTWTVPAGPYPGDEFVWVDEVPVLYRDSCPRLAFGELYYGASTAKGFTVVVPAGVMLTQNFTDLASNISFTPPTMPVFPLVGNVNPTRNLIYVNVP